jgi:hypothetical protein
LIGGDIKFTPRQWNTNWQIRKEIAGPL